MSAPSRVRSTLRGLAPVLVVGLLATGCVRSERSLAVQTDTGPQEEGTTCLTPLEDREPGAPPVQLDVWHALNAEAKTFAARLRKEAGPNSAEQVRLAFRLATARKASEAEVDRALRLMRRLETEERLSGEASLEQLCLLVLNLNEFMYLD